MYDAIIVGGSFAGLAAARQLRGHRVLVVDQRPIGTHQTSTCGVPLATAAALGVAGTALEIHHQATIHVGRHALRYPLHDPYMTVDYHAFCQALLAQTDADVWLAKATQHADGVVSTTQGAVRGRFVVDATGWQGLQLPARARDLPACGYGIETELWGALPLAPGLHLYSEKRIVRNGYAWVFPCGSRVRIGVGTFEPGVRLGPVLDAFLARFGLRRGVTHGGVMPIRRRAPLAGSLFVVGDAAGQCLPLLAEGIRTASYFATGCGRAIAAVLAGHIAAAEARAQYAALVQSTAPFHHLLTHVQAFVAWMPEWLRVGILSCMALPPVARRLVALYLRASGGPSGAPARAAALV